MTPFEKRLFFKNMQTAAQVRHWASWANGGRATGDVVEPDDEGAKLIARALQLLAAHEALPGCTDHRKPEVGDIVQIDPDTDKVREEFRGKLLIVTQLVSGWGVQGYVDGIAKEPGVYIIRVEKAAYAPTGGRAVWSIE